MATTCRPRRWRLPSSRLHVSLALVSATSLNPILALARAKLLCQSGQYADAADILASLLDPDLDEASLAAWLEAAEEGRSDALLHGITERLRSRHGGEPSHAALAERLRLIGAAARQAGNHARVASALDCHRALARLDPEADQAVLRVLADCAKELRDYDKRRRHLTAWLAYRRLPIAVAPAAGESIEVDTTAIPPAEAAAALAKHGAIVLRKLIDPASYPALIADFETANPTEVIALRIGGTPIMESAAALVPDYLTRLLRHLMGCEPALLPQYSFMRGIKLGQHRMVPYHQDINNFEAEMVNCWVPLTPCLGNAPRLEVVAARLDELVETGMDTGDFKWIEESLVRTRFPAASIVAPPVDLGDAILLLGTTIHRSFYTEDTVEKRFSMELRFGPASTRSETAGGD